MNLKKILPAIVSIVIFSSAFIFLILRNSENPENKLQLSPRSYLYMEKFGVVKHYKDSDVSYSSFFKNVRINETSGTSEPKIIGNPKNKNILAVSANDFSLTNNSARIFISQDKGLTWHAKEIPMSPKFNKSTCSDPWLDYDEDGNLHYVCVQKDAFNNSRKAIYFTRSTDNGTTWERDYFVDFNTKESVYFDLPKICIDKSSSLKNSIYIIWIEIKNLKSHIMFSKSLDGGKTFTSPASIENDEVDHCSVISNLKGDLFIAYLKDENKICIKKSTDAGVSWFREPGCIDIKPSGNKDENQFIIKNAVNNGIRINSEPSLAVTRENDLVLVYSAANTNNDLSDIYCAKIKNNTDEVTIPVKVNSDNTLNDQYLPAIATDESNNIYIMYQDSRNDANNITAESYISISTDGGSSFKDEKLSTTEYNPSEVGIAKYFGDYNSCMVSEGQFIGVWTDGRNNNFDIYAGTFKINDFMKNKND